MPAPTRDVSHKDSARSTTELGRSLMLLSSRLYRLETEALEKGSVRLSLRQFRILQRIDQGTSSMTALANMASRRLSTVSKSVDSLVRQGLLTREHDPADRRTYMLFLADRGREVLKEKEDAIDDLIVWLVHDIHGDHEEVVTLLNAVYEKAASRLRAD
jgi:DNA-binding MarR family transcriptional regulator